jgi:hypothetical protein
MLQPTKKQIEDKIKFLEKHLLKDLGDPQRQMTEAYIKKYKEFVKKLDKGTPLGKEDVKIWMT